MLTRDKSREDNLHFRTDGYGRKDVKSEERRERERNGNISDSDKNKNKSRENKLEKEGTRATALDEVSSSSLFMNETYNHGKNTRYTSSLNLGDTYFFRSHAVTLSLLASIPVVCFRKKYVTY